MHVFRLNPCAQVLQMTRVHCACSPNEQKHPLAGCNHPPTDVLKDTFQPTTVLSTVSLSCQQNPLLT